MTEPNPYQAPAASIEQVHRPAPEPPLRLILFVVGFAIPIAAFAFLVVFAVIWNVIVGESP